MYQVDKRSHKHTKLRKRTVWLVVILVASGLLYVLFHLQITPKQTLHNAPPISKAYEASPKQVLTISKKELDFELALGWKEVSVPQTAYSPRYVFKDSKFARILEIYIDNPPQHYGVNKALVVDSTDGSIAHETVSDNCTTFTDINKKDSQSGLAPAKWREVDFLCDMANTSRAVVGTISKDGINTVAVTTQAGAAYKVFIGYTDNEINPDYSALYGILDSMKFH